MNTKISLSYFNHIKCMFSTHKSQLEDEKVSRIFVKNNNLRFEDENYQLTMHFFMPKVTTKDYNIYQIKRQCSLLSFSFVPKKTSLINSESVDQRIRDNNSKKLIFSFQYDELGSLLKVTPNSNTQIMIKRQKKADQIHNVQWFKMHNQASKGIIRMVLKQAIEKDKENQQNTFSLVEFDLNYSQHRIFFALIKSSLFELSGSSLLFEIKKLQQKQQSLEKSNQIAKNINRQVESYYK